MMRSANKNAVVGAVLITLLIAAVVAINSGLVASQFAEDGSTVRAEFATSAQLHEGNPVRIDGITVGRVENTDLAPGGRSAIVEMVVFDSGGTIRRDAKARVRWRTALGGTFAVDLERGTATEPELGNTVIPLARTQSQAEIEEALAFNQGGARQGLRTTLSELPEALQPLPVTSALDGLDREAPALAETLAVVRGSREAGLRRVVRSTARTVRAVDTTDDHIEQVVEGAAATMNVTAQRRAELQRTFRLAGDIQPAVRAQLVSLRRTLENAAPLLADLTAAAPQVAPTLAHLRPTVRSADELLTTARPVAGSLQRTARSVATTARSGSRLVSEIEPSVERTAKEVLPGLAERDPVTKLRTYEIAGPTIASLNGAGSTFDAEGHLFRFPALGGERAIANLTPCNVLLTDPEASAILKCKELLGAFKKLAAYRGPTVKGQK